MFKKYKILSLIPARIGSKGLKNKNVKIFFNKPLISWSIKASKKSKYIDYTLVSSDSEKIINISKKLRVHAPFKRPKNLALDNSKIKDVIFHSFDWLRKKKLKFDYFILLQPTSPLRNAKHIDDAIKYYFKVSKKTSDTMVSVTEAPIKTSLIMKTEKKYAKFAINDNKNIKNLRRQCLKKYFIPNGAIYFANIKRFKGDFFKKNMIYFEMPNKISVDIDDIKDFNKGIKYKNNY